jgi:RNA polymerase sigma-70 factor (ECF subfamily)
LNLQQFFEPRRDPTANRPRTTGMTAIPIQLGSMFPFAGGGKASWSRQPIAPSVPSQSNRNSRPIAESAHMIQSDRGVAKPGAAAKPLTELDLDHLTDELLLDAYLRGDRAAFTTLMSRYSNELLHFLTRFLGSRAAADDVFQETFLQIHLSAQTFDPERRFKPWLFTIAANKARDYHRKHSRWNAVSLSASIDSEGQGECFVDLLEADVDHPDVPLLDAERSRLVKSVVDSLPGHLREILLLSYFQRLSYNQIADSLEIPLGTVKSRLHTAVAAFARAWKEARRDDREGLGDSPARDQTTQNDKQGQQSKQQARRQDDSTT